MMEDPAFWHRLQFAFIIIIRSDSGKVRPAEDTQGFY